MIIYIYIHTHINPVTYILLHYMHRKGAKGQSNTNMFLSSTRSYYSESWGSIKTQHLWMNRLWQMWCLNFVCGGWAFENWNYRHLSTVCLDRCNTLNFSHLFTLTPFSAISQQQRAQVHTNGIFQRRWQGVILEEMLKGLHQFGILPEIMIMWSWRLDLMVLSLSKIRDRWKW